MIYDCFIFSNEIELLKTRLEYYSEIVDRFVIIEAAFTFSGLNRDLVYPKIKDDLIKYEGKIIYFPLYTVPDSKSAWDIEYYVRDQIRNCLIKSNVVDEDIIMISDVDEILNLSRIKPGEIKAASLIKISTYYHFINLKAHEVINVNLITPYKFIKTENLGDRYKYYRFVSEQWDHKEINGWHLTYMFGGEMVKYIEKINSFSHQEYNSDYYKNPERLTMSIKYALDIFDREYAKYKFIDISKNYDQYLIRVLKNQGLTTNWIQSPPSIWKIKSLKEIPYYIKHVKNLFWWAKQNLAKSKFGLMYSKLKKKFLKK
jgi:beta-1,4-mannosyl-glycoprotein beta-1,4-N-acetylglucosaminyltransferase